VEAVDQIQLHEHAQARPTRVVLAQGKVYELETENTKIKAIILVSQLIFVSSLKSWLKEKKSATSFCFKHPFWFLRRFSNTKCVFQC
jgi:hypothetical protein